MKDRYKPWLSALLWLGTILFIYAFGTKVMPLFTDDVGTQIGWTWVALLVSGVIVFYVVARIKKRKMSELLEEDDSGSLEVGWPDDEWITDHRQKKSTNSE